ncbi:type VI secretion system-associated FHA domain protein TagH [Microbulbifer hainanensis]|uniref:type VI secretion system-associated FHA domain protein TagH n=1 Tax=Microbulbifer hainanensis TaxID=2735675 RepID=UPI00186964C7|nr:type VI secretion system-associated FHA domain protein TagH [Microbulbifer hainanensis]
MDLVLSIVADPEGANMLKHTKLFTAAGGSLGRADSNDWVLPDPNRVVSSRHATISFGENQYFVEDQSTNGTYYNGAADPLGKGNRVALKDGDMIAIGDYQLRVSVRRPAADPGLPKGLGSADFLDGSDRTTFSSATAEKMQHQAEAQELDSWLEPGSLGQGSGTGEWGYVGSQPADTDDKLLSPESEPLDPLAGLGSGGNRVSTAQWQDDDDWWKDGSSQDHAPADRHAMQYSAREAVVAEAPRPPAEAPLAPEPVSASQPPGPAPMDNPFADSLAVMQSQQIAGAPGFDLPPTGAGAAGHGHAQQQTPPPQPGAAVSPPQQPPISQAPPTAQVPPPRPAPASDARQVPGSTADAGRLAAALGLNLSPAQQAELDHEAAGIVQETVNRLIDLLRARTSIKNELRVQRTMIQTEANNPLKFSATANDALAAMFAGNGAFMAPQQAVRDSFDDLSDHQVAVLAGMRAGYDAMLKFFSPENIERRVNSQGGVFTNKNAKNWEGFVALYREQVADPEAAYRRLFGDEFASTYEHQLSELKNARSLSE